MTIATSPPWPEDDFQRYLRAERRVYAWCLVRLAGITEQEAKARSIERYPNPNPDEPSSEEVLGVLFNMGAWRVATRDIFPTHPGHRQPEEFGLATEYEVEKQRQFHSDLYREPLSPDK